MKSKMMTVGQIKTLDLTRKFFKIEPITAYKFVLEDDDETKWKIIFKDSEATNLSDLRLCDKDMEFNFGADLTSAMVMLKQSKAKIEVYVDDLDNCKNGSAMNVMISIP